VVGVGSSTNSRMARVHRAFARPRRVATASPACGYSFCSSSYLCTFSSTVGCQLSLAKSRRHGGSEERNACLLRYVEGSACSGDDDVVIAREQRDQRQQNCSGSGEAALLIQPQNPIHAKPSPVLQWYTCTG